MYDDHIGRGAGILSASGENVLHVVSGEVHLVVPAVYELCKADVELCDVAFTAFQDELVAPRHHLQVGEIGAEFSEDLVAHAIDFYGVDGFQRDGFLHMDTNILHFIGIFLEK